MTQTRLRLERGRLEAVLDQVSAHQLKLLSWLTWLPLLSREELAQVLSEHPKTLWEHLDRLLKLELVEMVTLNEAGHHPYRYHLTDLGLYALCCLHPQPLSAKSIARSYPIMGADLMARLARPHVHRLLCCLVCHLLAHHPADYTLSSYQQPYWQRYSTVQQASHWITFEAALLLKAPDGSQYAFVVWVDDPEWLFNQKDAALLLKRFMHWRESTQLRGDILPYLLILSRRERFPFWRDLLVQTILKGGVALPSGAIAESAQLVEQGATSSIWLPFEPLTLGPEPLPATTAHVGLGSLLQTPASPQTCERLSQYFTFREALQAELSPLAQRTRRFPCYVEGCLRQQAAPLGAHTLPRLGYRQSKGKPPLQYSLQAQHIWDAFHSDRADRLHMSSLLSLALSEPQIAILTTLLRHPYLARDDLLTLLYPDQKEDRLLLRQLMPLLNLRLVQVALWQQAEQKREQERYQLTEPALRYLATRHNLSPSAYLEPLLLPGRKRPTAEQRRRISPFETEQVIWVQRGIFLLQRQAEHTLGLYGAMRCIVAAARTTGAYRLLAWKSAREAVRSCWDPFVPWQRLNIRPDAEVLFTVPEKADQVQTLLIEYDRGTVLIGDYQQKFRAYADYQQVTRSSLPPIVMITRRDQSHVLIRQAIANIQAFEVHVVFLSEQQVRQDGLLCLLPRLAAKG